MYKNFTTYIKIPIHIFRIPNSFSILKIQQLPNQNAYTNTQFGITTLISTIAPILHKTPPPQDYIHPTRLHIIPLPMVLLKNLGRLPPTYFKISKGYCNYPLSASIIHHLYKLHFHKSIRICLVGCNRNFEQTNLTASRTELLVFNL